MSGRPWALITGGGTAGHVVPALALAEALVAGGHPRETVAFVGSRRGVEGRMVTEAGFEVTLLPGRGIVRRASFSNLAAVAGLAVASAKAWVLLGRCRPAVVVSIGGYASLPCALAALARRVPLVLVNIDAVPGGANRLVGRFARACAVAWEDTGLPRAEVTGTPVREEILAVRRDRRSRLAAREALGLPVDRHVVVAFGGSLGSASINSAVAGLVRLWTLRGDLAIYHVVGSRDWRARPPGDGGGISSAAVEPAPSAASPSEITYRAVEYQDRMDLVYSAADLVVSRAGASSVAELAAAGLPSILVPLPGAPGDHQGANARKLHDAGAAVVLPDSELNPARLAEEVHELLDATARLEAMACAAARLARRSAAGSIAAMVETHASHTRDGRGA